MYTFKMFSVISTLDWVHDAAHLARFFIKRSKENAYFYFTRSLFLIHKYFYIYTHVTWLHLFFPWIKPQSICCGTNFNFARISSSVRIHIYKSEETAQRGQIFKGLPKSYNECYVLDSTFSTFGNLTLLIHFGGF